MTFTRNIPPPTQLLSVSQPLIYNNFNSSDTTMGIDHYMFSDTTPNIGYHKVVHLPLFDTNPPNMAYPTRSGSGATYTNLPVSTAGIAQVFDVNYVTQATVSTTDTQLVHITGTGIISQLTGHLIQTNISNPLYGDGWQWVGGILLQWGSQAFSGHGTQSTTLAFKDRFPGAIPFPNALLNVQATLYPDTVPTGNSQSVSVLTTSRTQFTWNYSGGSAYDGFFWFAIGY